MLLHVGLEDRAIGRDLPRVVHRLMLDAIASKLPLLPNCLANDSILRNAGNTRLRAIALTANPNHRQTDYRQADRNVQNGLHILSPEEEPDS
jgi:hypothetical protein